jgi:hypothetical protein
MTTFFKQCVLERKAGGEKQEKDFYHGIDVDTGERLPEPDMEGWGDEDR